MYLRLFVAGGGFVSKHFDSVCLCVSVRVDNSIHSPLYEIILALVEDNDR